jgi:amidase
MKATKKPLSSAQNKATGGSWPVRDVASTRQMLARGEISCLELLEEHRQAVTRLNPSLNALPTLCLSRARGEAKRLDKLLVAQRTEGQAAGLGPLAGLPYCAKDMFDTEGVITTYGSPIYAQHRPPKDSEIVARIRRAGALLIGKSNTPEFAAGSQTFNRVFGATRNPWDLSRTCGGSSGGSAVALRTGMVILADGSDLAASLRNPASFCSVVGMRPSSHLEPRLQSGANPFNTLSVVGPMARSVADLRELFTAIFDPAGCRPDKSLKQWCVQRNRESQSRKALNSKQKKMRIGFSSDWGGLPVQREVRHQMQACAKQLAENGVEIIEGFPKLSEMRQAFLTLRGLFFVAELGELYGTHRDQLKDTVVWNIEQGLKLTAAEIAHAEKLRSAARRQLEDYMQSHNLDALAGPTNQVLPFDLETAYVSEIDGIQLETYVDWLASNFIFSVAGLPALSLPAGFARPSPQQLPLPVGLQLVGPWASDHRLMNTAEQVESILAPLNAPFSFPDLPA